MKYLDKNWRSINFLFLNQTISRQPRKMIFSIQTYLNQTR
jgi:hypothetical protein